MQESITKEHSKELVYRYLLWVSFGFAINYLSSIASETGGEYISKAISKPNGIYWNVVTSAGLLILIISTFFKDVSLACYRFASLNNAVTITEKYITKISSDLLLAGFGLGSFIIGSTLFFIIQNPVGVKISALIFVTLAFNLLLMAVGILSILAKEETYSFFLRNWFSFPKNFRYPFYPISSAVLAWYLWIY